MENLDELIRAVDPYTMLRSRKLKAVANCVQQANEEGLEGDIVQCGCWRGGSGALMAALAPQRHTWLFDCFEPLDAYLGEKDTVRKIHNKAATPEHVEKAIRAAGVDRRKVSIVTGDLGKTLPPMYDQIGSIAVLHLDVDWYEPTTCALFNLYEFVSHQGFVIIDDYHYHPGCKQAVKDFFPTTFDDLPGWGRKDSSVWFRRP